MGYLQIGINLSISIIVAIVTANLTIRSFYRQEIWLRKELKYSEIIQEMSVLQTHYSHLFDNMCGCENNIQILEEEFLAAKIKLELLSINSSLIIKPDVSDIILDLFKSSSKKGDELKGDYGSYYDRMAYEVKEAMNKIINLAKKDLKIIN